MNEVIPFTLNKRSPQWPYCVAIEEGTTIYVIQHMDRYFKWSYLHYDAAMTVANRVVCDYNPSNWVREIDNTCPSDITVDTIYSGGRRELYAWEAKKEDGL